MERKCADCALKAIKGGMCPIFGADMSEEHGCPHFTTVLTSCEICGNLILNGAVIQEDNEMFHVMCGDCANGNPCKTCARVHYCLFESDQSCPEPPFVMAQQRQGNMVVQQQIQNPKRVQATCESGCFCYSKEHGCMREYGCGCNDLKYNWRN